MVKFNKTLRSNWLCIIEFLPLIYKFFTDKQLYILIDYHLNNTFIRETVYYILIKTTTYTIKFIIIS